MGGDRSRGIRVPYLNDTWEVLWNNGFDPEGLYCNSLPLRSGTKTGIEDKRYPSIMVLYLRSVLVPFVDVHGETFLDRPVHLSKLGRRK